jgi:hypothetical protein
MEPFKAELEDGVIVTAPHARVVSALMRDLARPSPLVDLLPATILSFTASSHCGLLPAYGSSVPGNGGRFGGIFPGRAAGKRYAIFVPDVDAAKLPKLEFGGRGKDISGAGDSDDGAANTKALLASGHAHPAAKACADFELEGNKDYYLGSRNEMRFLSITVPDLFEKKWYWTSTRYSSYGAYGQAFGDGVQNSYGYLDGECLVRPIRREFID